MRVFFGLLSLSSFVFFVLCRFACPTCQLCLVAVFYAEAGLELEAYEQELLAASTRGVTHAASAG
jgi:hypothetical protein